MIRAKHVVMIRIDGASVRTVRMTRIFNVALTPSRSVAGGAIWRRSGI